MRESRRSGAANRWHAAAALGALALAAAPAGADVVRLRGGDILEGKAKDLGESVQVVAGETVVEMPWSAVEVIDRDATAAGEYQARLAKVDGKDARGLYGLALWARRQGLEAEARDLAGKVVALDPSHEAARALLGEQRVGGDAKEPSCSPCSGASSPQAAWKSGADLMAAKGFVNRGGKWLLRSEAEALDRRADREKAASGEEARAAKLLESLGDPTPAVRKYAAEAMASLDAALKRRLYLVGARHRNAGVRAASAAGLGVEGDEGVVRTLLQLAVKDGEPEVRAAAGQALHAVALPEIERPLVRALWSENPVVAMNAADALGAWGSRATVETLIRRVEWAAGPSNRANIQVMNQVSYISDYDVEIAQLSQIGDPIISILREGIVLDVKVLGAHGTDVEIERRAFSRALERITGKSFGTDAAAWVKWWKSEGEGEYAAARAAGAEKH
ncbi:MAG: HEAT repeat domain-containing protein [Planctomycetes bacterium]|nr:HEAT repeat domain-containing protein [Planctomycetota bacterium]